MGAGKAQSPKQFNRDVAGKVFHMEGRNVTINGAVCRILASDVDGKILLATTAASAVSSFDSQADFAKSCLMIKTDAATGVAGLYENVGTAASSSFNLIGAISAGEITLARGNLLVGNSSGVAAALDANDSGKILVGDGTDLASVAVSGDATLAANGALTIGAGAVTLAKIAAAAKPIYHVVGMGLFTTAGGDANESITATGCLGTDTALVWVQKAGASPVTVDAITPGTDAIAVTMSGDPSTDHKLGWIITRAAA